MKPELEEEEDQIDQQRNKRMLVDVTSAKIKGKAPMCSSTDLSADKVFDKKPHRKTIKLRVNYPTVSSALNKEPLRKPFKSGLKYSSSSLTVDCGSSSGESHKSGLRLGHVVSGSIAGSGSTNGETSMDDMPSSLGYVEITSGAEIAFGCNDEEVVLELPVVEIMDSLSEMSLGSHRTEPKTAKEMDAEIPETSKKKDNLSRKRKLDLRWTNTEDMLLALKDSPQMRMEAVCALYRQVMKTHKQPTIMLSYSHYTKYFFFLFLTYFFFN